MNKKLIRLTEGDLHRIVKESVNNVLTEHDGTYETIDDYYESFYENVLQANAALYRALSFCGEDMKKDALVKRARKAFQITNDMAYFIEQRRNK